MTTITCHDFYNNDGNSISEARDKISLVISTLREERFRNIPYNVLSYDNLMGKATLTGTECVFNVFCIFIHTLISLLYLFIFIFVFVTRINFAKKDSITFATENYDHQIFYLKVIKKLTTTKETYYCIGTFTDPLHCFMSFKTIVIIVNNDSSDLLNVNV